MGRLGDIADVATFALLAVGGYLIYRTWKGVEAAIPEFYQLELPGGITIPDIRLKEPIVPTWFEPHITPPDFAAGEEPIGIPGPALRDPTIPTIMDAIVDIVSPFVYFTPLPAVPDFAAGEEPIGIPGPALRDPTVPSIVDRIIRVITPPEPEIQVIPEPIVEAQWGAYPLAFVGRYEIL